MKNNFKPFDGRSEEERHGGILRPSVSSPASQEVGQSASRGRLGRAAVLSDIEQANPRTPTERESDYTSFLSYLGRPRASSQTSDALLGLEHQPESNRSRANAIGVSAEPKKLSIEELPEFGPEREIHAAHYDKAIESKAGRVAVRVESITEPSEHGSDRQPEKSLGRRDDAFWNFGTRGATSEGNPELSASAVPVVEATRVADPPEDPEDPVIDAVAVEVDEAPSSFCKQYRAYICAGMSLLVVGAMSAAIGVLAGSRKEDPADPRFFADREDILCSEVQPGTEPGQRLYETIQECCIAEFGHQQSNECITRSLDTSLLAQATPVATSSVFAAVTTKEPTTHTSPPVTVPTNSGHGILGPSVASTTLDISTYDEQLVQPSPQSPALYYAEKDNRCSDNIPGQSVPDISYSAFETLEECCEEFGPLEYNECLMNSITYHLSSLQKATPPAAAVTTQTDLASSPKELVATTGLSTSSTPGNPVEDLSESGTTTPGPTSSIAPQESSTSTTTTTSTTSSPSSSSSPSTTTTTTTTLSSSSSSSSIWISEPSKPDTFITLADPPIHSASVHPAPTIQAIIQQTIIVDHDGDQYYFHYKSGCVWFENIQKLKSLTLEACAKKCIEHGDACKGIEWFTADVQTYKRGDCNLSSSTDTTGCPNDTYKTDFYVRTDVATIDSTLSLLTPNFATELAATTEGSLIWKQGRSFSGEGAYDWSGDSISLSSDGTTLAIGSPGKYDNDDRPGYVKLYRATIKSNLFSRGWTSFGSAILGEANGDRFGHSLSLSEDGNTVAIGASGHWEKGDRPGYVKVYVMEGSGGRYLKEDSTIMEGQPLVETDHDVPSVLEFEPEPGGPDFSVFDKKDWTQLGQTIDGEADGDQFGGSVALSPDGKVLAVGANTNSGNGAYSGHVKVYEMSSDESSSQWHGPSFSSSSNHELIAPLAEGPSNYESAAIDWQRYSPSFGSSSSPTSNNELLGPLAETDMNSPSIFNPVQQESSVARLRWKQLGQTIEGESGDLLGGALSISDKETLVIGGPSSNNNAGYVKAYRMESTGWALFSTLGLDSEPGDQYGQAVSLSPDGKTLAIGAPGYRDNTDRPGYVRVYREVMASGKSFAWENIGQTIEGEADGDRFGASVALSADGQTLAVGAPYNDGNGDDSGHVRVYRIDGSSNWEQVGQDIGGHREGDTSGWSVVISPDGEFLAIDSIRSNIHGTDSGEVRTFTLESQLQ